MATIRIEREDPRSWPLFANHPVPSGMAVLSVDVGWAANETVEARRALAISRVEAAIAADPLFSVARYWLLIAGRAWRPYNRVQALMWSRRDFWTDMDDDDAWPSDSRSSLRLEFPEDRTALCGSANFDHAQLGRALASTLNRNAVVLALPPSQPDPLEQLVHQKPYPGEVRQGMFLACVASGLNQLSVFRSFGSWCEPSLGVDILGPSESLNGLERLLHR